MGNFFGFPAFQKKYGNLTPEGYQISAPWQVGLSNGSGIGQVIGLLGSGMFADRYGNKKTLYIGYVLITIFIFIVFFADNIKILLGGEILCGIAFGMFQAVVTAYASEVAPVALRGYLTSYNNACWNIGQLVAGGTIFGLLKNVTAWSYRIPFAVQWAWPIPLLIVAIFAPESPWWLVRQGRIDDAVKSLKRLTDQNADPDFDAEKTVAMMAHTHELEQEIVSGSSYSDLFKGVDRRRTFIACLVYCSSTLCGGSFS